MSPVVAETADDSGGFVVVERLVALRRVQKEMVENMQVVKSKVACLGIRIAAVERAAEINIHMRRVMLSFVAAVTPVVMSVMLDQNLPQKTTPTVDFVRSISKLLLAFAVCVGIPLLLQAITDLQQVQYPQRHLDTVAATPAAEECPVSGDEADSEDEEEKEEDGYVATATEE